MGCVMFHLFSSLFGLGRLENSALAGIPIRSPNVLYGQTCLTFKETFQNMKRTSRSSRNSARTRSRFWLKLELGFGNDGKPINVLLWRFPPKTPTGKKGTVGTSSMTPRRIAYGR